MTTLVLYPAVAALAIFAATKVGGWRGRALWLILAALIMTIALDAGFDMISFRSQTGCWPFVACDTFRFDLQVPNRANKNNRERTKDAPISADRIRVAAR